MAVRLSLVVTLVALVAEIMASCLAPEDSMTFKIEFRGEWNPLSFPKQYPKFRKNAQFSPLVGAVHNSEYTMWEEGRTVSRDFRYFVNDDVTTKLVNSIKRSSSASSSFLATKIKTGVGKTSKTFEAKRDFNFVSFAVHLIPSPDWFVGISKLDLCQGTEWLTEPVSFDLQPFDAGTDQGFMFTSPDFDENPFKPVQQITSSNPGHPANSFFYPQLDQLPRIASVIISRAIDDSAAADNTQGPLAALAADQPQPSAPRPKQKPKPKKQSSEIPSHIPSWFHAINQNLDNEASLPERMTPVDCTVTTWGAWGLCDTTCAVGFQRRYRIVQQKPLNGGRKCPTLIETRICNIKLALKKPQKKKCANKKMKKERKKYNAKQAKKIQASLNNIYIV